jgi:hypothetical protein
MLKDTAKFLSISIEGLIIMASILYGSAAFAEGLILKQWIYIIFAILFFLLGKGLRALRFQSERSYITITDLFCLPISSLFVSVIPLGVLYEDKTLFNLTTSDHITEFIIRYFFIVIVLILIFSAGRVINKNAGVSAVLILLVLPTIYFTKNISDFILSVPFLVQVMFGTPLFYLLLVNFGIVRSKFIESAKKY